MCEETSKIGTKPALPKWAFCSVKMEQVARAMLSPTGRRNCYTGPSAPPHPSHQHTHHNRPKRVLRFFALLAHLLSLTRESLQALLTGAVSMSCSANRTAIWEERWANFSFLLDWAAAPTLWGKRCTLGEPTKCKFCSFFCTHKSAEFYTI